LKRGVFIDSGAFIAFLVRSDRLHEDAVGLFSRPPERWSTSALVVSETYGWFLHRLGEGAARAFRSLLESIPSLEVLYPDFGHWEAVCRKLDELRGVKLSFVDVSSLVWLETLGIREVWGTDHHLGVEGARVIPGQPTP
jgi:predicted nucleic acid-binding protein